MNSVAYELASGEPDGSDHATPFGDNPSIKDPVSREALQIRVIAVELDQISKRSGHDLTGGSVDRSCAAFSASPKQRTSY